MLFLNSPGKRLKQTCLCDMQRFSASIYTVQLEIVSALVCVKFAYAVCTNYHVMLCIVQTVPSKDVGLFEMTKCVM